MKTITRTVDTANPLGTTQWVAGKAANLTELKRAGFQVPEFIVSPTDLDAAMEALGKPLVVRSSASGEDGTELSFAGQFRSFLNLNTVDEIRQAIRDCHASLHCESVAQYCRHHHLDPQSLRMQVIVQRMIQPEIAGVAFTVNPVTGVEEVVVEACEGLSDDLLAGRCSSLPTSHPLLRRWMDPIRQLAAQIQRHFGAPQDIEFAIEGDTIYVLQTRPITRIHFAESIGQWTTADFRDGGVSSTVCTPLMASLYQFIWDRSLKSTLRDLKLIRSDFQASEIFFGRPYWNLAAVKECVSKLPGFNEREFDRDLSVQIHYEGDGRVTPITALGIVRAIPTLVAVKKFLRWQRQAAERMLAGPIESRLRNDHFLQRDAATGFRKLIETDYCEIETTYFRTIYAASLAKLDLMSAFPDIDSSVDYSSLVSGLPPLRHVEPLRAVMQLDDRSPENLDRVIDTYRHHYRSGLDLIHPRWDEDRVFVRRMLAELPDSAGQNPSAIYQSAMESIRRRLPRRKRGALNRKLNRLREFLWLREQLRDLSSYAYYLIRRYAIALGEQRQLGQDIFFQSFQEIFSDKRDHIESNRLRYESYRNFSAPGEIGSGFQYQPVPATASICGIAASPGIHDAQAFVARDVEQASQMPRGQILVCPYTDPGWTVVLDRAGGVVTETGGLLSHAAIICREYGIPAVLSVADATRRIAFGKHYTIDGSRGCVSPSFTSQDDVQ